MPLLQLLPQMMFMHSVVTINNASTNTSPNKWVLTKMVTIKVTKAAVVDISVEFIKFLTTKMVVTKVAELSSMYLFLPGLKCRNMVSMAKVEVTTARIEIKTTSVLVLAGTKKF